MARPLAESLSRHGLGSARPRSDRRPNNMILRGTRKGQPLRPPFLLLSGLASALEIRRCTRGVNPNTRSYASERRRREAAGILPNDPSGIRLSVVAKAPVAQKAKRPPGSLPTASLRSGSVWRTLLELQASARLHPRAQDQLLGLQDGRTVRFLSRRCLRPLTQLVLCGLPRAQARTPPPAGIPTKDS